MKWKNSSKCEVFLTKQKKNQHFSVKSKWHQILKSILKCAANRVETQKLDLCCCCIFFFNRETFFFIPYHRNTNICTGGLSKQEKKKKLEIFSAFQIHKKHFLQSFLHLYGPHKHIKRVVDGPVLKACGLKLFLEAWILKVLKSKASMSCSYIRQLNEINSWS